MAFDAFVSYSHAVDGELAPAVQRAMQRLAKPWFRVRALRVFRDESALSANPHLWSSIEIALDESDWFILLASPDAAASEWVDRELRHWLATKSVERLLVVVTDGTWEWDADAHALTGTAVPSAIRDIFGDEPRHVDLRWARTETDLDLRNSRFRDVVAQLAAPAHGIAKDELEGEDIRLHRRARRLARGATSVLVLLLVLSVVLGGLTWQQRSAARHQAAIARRAASATLGEELAGQALNAARTNRGDLAMLLAVEGYRVDPRLDERSSLLSVVVDQPTLERQLHGLTDTTSALAFSSNGRLLAAATESGHVRVWDTVSGRPLAHQPKVSNSYDAGSQSSPTEIKFADSGRLLVVSSDGTGTDRRRRFASVIDVATGRVLASLPDVSPPGGAWAVSAGAPVFAASDASGTVEVRDIRTSRRTASIATGLPAGGVALSPDGTSVAVSRNWVTGDARVWNVAGGRLVGPGCTAGESSTAVGGSTPATTPSIDPSLNVAVLEDHVTVRTWGEDSEGTSGAISTCRTDTGSVSTQQLPFTQSEFAGLAPDGHTIASRGEDGTIQLLDMASTRAAIASPVRAPLVIHLAPLVTAPVVFSPDGHHMTAVEQGGVVRIWRTTDALWQTSPEPRTDQAAAGRRIQGERFADPTGRIAVSGSGVVIDARTGRSLARIPEPVGTDPLASFDLSWPLLAVVAPHGLVVADLQRHTTRSLPTSGLACSGGTGTVTISAANRIIVRACGNQIEAIDISSWPWRLPQHPVRSAIDVHETALSPDGRALAVLGDTGLQLFAVNGTSVHARRTFPEAASAFSGLDGAVGFSSDSHTLVFARAGGLVELIGLKQPTPESSTLAQPDGHIPTEVAVSPDGALLAVANEGGDLRIWDLHAKQLLGSVPSAGTDGTVSLTEQSVVVRNSSGPSASLRRFDLDPTSWERRACTIANRNLTRSEWQQYLPGVPYRKTCPALP